MAAGTREILIAPQKVSITRNLTEVLRFRELLFFLVWRDIKVRYKQSVLGFAWVVFKPLLTMIVFTVIFGRVAKFPSDGVPYPIFVLMGIIPWGFFSSTLNSSTNSVVSGSNLISKVYFPRIIVPIGTSLSLMVDVLVSFVLLLVMMAIYGIMPGAGVVFLPLLFVLVAVTALGPGMLFSAMYVKYRDVGYAIPVLAQIWMYVTPVIYPAGFIPERFRWLLYFNPMTGVIEAFRGCLLPGKQVDMTLLAGSCAISAVMFIAGYYYFNLMERSFADNI